MGQMSLRYLIFMRCLHKWFEFASVTCIETAEDLVVFQTKNLDTYDQTFHGTYEDVSENDYDPVRAAAIGSAGKHQYNFHHSCVADCKCADTQERKCVGKVAEQNFKQFEEALNKEHAFLFW